MPVTPKFHLTQSDEFVVLTVHVPYIRVSDLEYRIDGKVLSFYVKPYLLRLNFPNDLIDDDRAKAVYDPNTRNGTLTLHLPKAVKGQHFDDLDLLTRLKQPKRSATPAQPMIQVLSSTEFQQEREVSSTSLYAQCLAGYANLESKARTKEKNGTCRKYSAALLEMENVIAGKVSNVGEIVVSMQHEQEEREVLGRAVRYGFNNSFENFFKDVQEEFPELVQLEDPDKTPQNERRQLRIAAEDRDFNKDRFVTDLFGAEEDWLFHAFMRSEPFWVNKNNHDDYTAMVLTEEEQEELMSLDNVEILPLDGNERTAALCCIYDLVLANAYDFRMTKGESTVESAWTIRTLSASLSWLEAWSNPTEVLESIIHRTLVYPYIRHTDLTSQIVRDATNVFQCGKRAVLKCLLRVRRVFAHSDTFYLLNRLYLNDLCLWIQSVSDEEIEAFTSAVKEAVSVSNIEERVRWDIPEIVEQTLAGMEAEGAEPEHEDEAETEDASSSGESASESEDEESSSDSTEEDTEEDAQPIQTQTQTQAEAEVEEEPVTPFAQPTPSLTLDAADEASNASEKKAKIEVLL